jgi:hypothetical protein
MTSRELEILHIRNLELACSGGRVRIDDLSAAGDRVTVAFTLTYRHDRSGRDLTMTGLKSYRLRERQIAEFWGETDLYGLLRQAGLVPEQIPQLT